MQLCPKGDTLLVFFFQRRSLKCKNCNYNRDANKDSHTVCEAERFVLLQRLRHHGDFQQIAADAIGTFKAPSK